MTKDQQITFLKGSADVFASMLAASLSRLTSDEAEDILAQARQARPIVEDSISGRVYDNGFTAAAFDIQTAIFIVAESRKARGKPLCVTRSRELSNRPHDAITT